MKKKILAVMLSAVLAVTMLVGCGDSVETGGRAETTRTETGEQGTDTQLETEGYKQENDRGVEFPLLVSIISFQGDEKEKTLEYEYDGAGNVKCLQYNSDGSIMRWLEYEYNAFGNVTKLMLYDSDGNVIEWQQEYGYEYDTFGNVTKYMVYDSDGGISTWIEYGYEYDAIGNMTRYMKYEGDNNSVGVGENNAAGSVEKWQWQQEYEYNATGDMVKCITCNSDGSIREWQEYEYNATGDMVKCITYNSDGDIKEWQEYEYDTFGNVTKYMPGFPDGGAVASATDNSTIEKGGWCEYEYDAFGNMTKYMRYKSDGSVDECLENEYGTTGDLEKGIYEYENIQASFEREYDADSHELKFLFYSDTGYIPWEYDIETHSVICIKEVKYLSEIIE